MSDASSKTLFVVEDSAPNRKILSHLLKRLGFQVEEFENGKLAWKALSQSKTEISAIISDLMMPEMDGLELLTKVREDDKYKELPFLLVTAVADKDSITQAKDSKANGYLLKPISSEKVHTKIKEIFPDIKLKNPE